MQGKEKRDKREAEDKIREQIVNRTGWEKDILGPVRHIHRGVKIVIENMTSSEPRL